MKLSARWTTVSFLAASALGAAAFAFGCTVTSGDTTTSGNPDSGPATTDSGTDAAPTCEGNKQSAALVSAACQSCLNGSCCTELKGCFNLAVDGGAGALDCNAYSSCVSLCYEKAAGTDQTNCLEECNLAAGEGIQAAYDNVVNCAATKGCATACNLQEPPALDAGDDAADAADQ